MFVCAPLVAGMQAASAQTLLDPLPGGSLDPLTIPKYVTPLVIPPVLFDDGGTGMDITVAQRQIKQQVLPKGFPKTPLWAYGDPTKPNSFNNPAFTIEVTQNQATHVEWRNELVQNPKKCFYDKNVKWWQKKLACLYRPHIIRDKFNRPIIDQTLHWAAPNEDCLDGIARSDCRGSSGRPYWGPIPMVMHVHGAHVGPGSDGYPEAWWLPDASNIDCTNVAGYPRTRVKFDDYDCNGTFFESEDGADTFNALGKGYALDIYPNDQPTTTLWYHDHSLGITRLNVYAAAAGFWLIRDAYDSESGLLEGGMLPGPAPKLGDDPNGNPAVRKAIREIPIAIQPKSFNKNGTQFYPANRAFFEELGDGSVFAQNKRNGLNIPFLPDDTRSDIAPVWNPEAFFNTMVVNGSTWPELEVASERYRFRLLNASDGRFLNLALFEVTGPGPDGVMGTGDDDLGQELPFYQIGAEQGLLPKVVRIKTNFATELEGDGSDSDLTPGNLADQALLMGPAERADVIVDFDGLADGTIVRMTNTGPDEPFGGDFGAVNADTTFQVMQFKVNTALNTPGGDPSTPPASLKLDSNPGGEPKLGSSSETRDLALLEEESALLCVFVDAFGNVTLDPSNVPPGCNGLDPEEDPLASFPFGPKAAVLGVNGSTGGEVQLWDDPIAQNPALGAVETWELWNRSADAHPIHLHLVKFEVVNREVIGGATRGPEPWEKGWKDTVIAYPDEVTRIKAKFDIDGLYVWHCHLLSHEDNEMMVPFCVGALDACSPIPGV
jgi:FtsP/CotA-like multicopper oxidase with cupredoxin domain